jgi:hypothetical protein
MTACLALEKIPFREAITFAVTTGRANESLGPLQFKKIIPAGRLGPKPSLKLYQRHFLVWFYHVILLSR